MGEQLTDNSLIYGGSLVSADENTLDQEITLMIHWLNSLLSRITPDGSGADFSLITEEDVAVFIGYFEKKHDQLISAIDNAALNDNLEIAEIIRFLMDQVLVLEKEIKPINDLIGHIDKGLTAVVVNYDLIDKNRAEYKRLLNELEAYVADNLNFNNSSYVGKYAMINGRPYVAEDDDAPDLGFMAFFKEIFNFNLRESRRKGEDPSETKYIYGNKKDVRMMIKYISSEIRKLKKELKNEERKAKDMGVEADIFPHHRAMEQSVEEILTSRVSGGNSDTEVSKMMALMGIIKLGSLKEEYKDKLLEFFEDIVLKDHEYKKLLKQNSYLDWFKEVMASDLYINRASNPYAYAYISLVFKFISLRDNKYDTLMGARTQMALKTLIAAMTRHKRSADNGRDTGFMGIIRGGNAKIYNYLQKFWPREAGIQTEVYGDEEDGDGEDQVVKLEDEVSPQYELSGEIGAHSSLFEFENGVGDKFLSSFIKRLFHSMTTTRQEKKAEGKWGAVILPQYDHYSLVMQTSLGQKKWIFDGSLLDGGSVEFRRAFESFLKGDWVNPSGDYLQSDKGMFKRGMKMSEVDERRLSIDDMAFCDLKISILPEGLNMDDIQNSKAMSTVGGGCPLSIGFVVDENGEMNGQMLAKAIHSRVAMAELYEELDLVVKGVNNEFSGVMDDSLYQILVGEGKRGELVKPDEKAKPIPTDDTLFGDIETKKHINVREFKFTDDGKLNERLNKVYKDYKEATGFELPIYALWQLVTVMAMDGQESSHFIAKDGTDYPPALLVVPEQLKEVLSKFGAKVDTGELSLDKKGKDSVAIKDIDKFLMMINFLKLDMEVIKAEGITGDVTTLAMLANDRRVPVLLGRTTNGAVTEALNRSVSFSCLFERNGVTTDGSDVALKSFTTGGDNVFKGGWALIVSKNKEGELEYRFTYRSHPDNSDEIVGSDVSGESLKKSMENMLLFLEKGLKVVKRRKNSGVIKPWPKEFRDLKVRNDSRSEEE